MLFRVILSDRVSKVAFNTPLEMRRIYLGGGLGEGSGRDFQYSVGDAVKLLLIVGAIALSFNTPLEMLGHVCRLYTELLSKTFNTPLEMRSRCGCAPIRGSGYFQYSVGDAGSLDSEKPVWVYCFQYSVGDAQDGVLPRPAVYCRTFNTPLEMHVDETSVACALTYEPFNTPLEMRRHRRRYKLLYRQFTFNTPLEMPGI